jgi:hypothetical protein
VHDLVALIHSRQPAFMSALFMKSLISAPTEATPRQTRTIVNRRQVKDGINGAVALRQDNAAAVQTIADG